MDVVQALLLNCLTTIAVSVLLVIFFGALMNEVRRMADE